MQTEEQIDVMIRCEKGKTICICMGDSGKKCKDINKCEEDVVLRDKFRGWYDTYKRDKYGK